MAFHQAIQRLLLLGADLEPPEPQRAHAPVPPPRRLAPLIEAISTTHQRFNQRAVKFGNRYRSGFWAVYLLSAFAVLCAVLPLVLEFPLGTSPLPAGDVTATAAPVPRLQWRSRGTVSDLHATVRMWAVAEAIIIGAVITIYGMGRRHDWQGQWLHARATAELTGYLPLLSPLLDFDQPGGAANWYVRAFNPGQHLPAMDDVAGMCARIEPLARELVLNAWSEPLFVSNYARWTLDILDRQRRYHRAGVNTYKAVSRRLHAINASLFAMTFLAAILQLALHTVWLSLVATFFPALGASLYGALAQSEAYRLGTTSARLAEDLEIAAKRIQANATPSADTATLKAEIEAALTLILEEYEDWSLLVRPQRLPMA
jgi:hypothetical protein